MLRPFHFFAKTCRVFPTIRCMSTVPFGFNEEELNQFASDIESYTKENLKSPPKDDPFAKMSEEEISSYLSQQFNSALKEEQNESISKEQEKSFFDGVLKLHPFRKESREEFTASFKNMMKEMDPDIPFFYEFQRPDYSSFEGQRRMTIGFCGERGVGKSTLLNLLSSTSLHLPVKNFKKNLCTLQGLHTLNNTQFLFYDMPNVLTLKSSFLPEPRSTSFAELPVKQLDAIVAVIDATKPLTAIHREMLNKLSEFSYYNDLLLYIDLNKVDQVNPKPKLLLYSDAITEVICDKREQLIATTRNPTKQQLAWANEDIFMTSATEKEGTDDLIECFYKVAKPGEWVSNQAWEDPSFTADQICDIVREKLRKVANTKQYANSRINTTINQSTDEFTIDSKIMLNSDEELRKIEEIKQKLEKSVRREIANQVSRPVKLSISFIKPNEK